MPLHQEVMDSSSGVVTPYFDYDTRIVRKLINLLEEWHLINQ